jgi:Flp pilus assembly protein TadB
LNFLDSFSTNIQISNFKKIGSMGAELFSADRRTDMTKQIVSFRNFANAPKNLMMLQSIEKCNHVLSVYFKHTLVVIVIVGGGCGVFVVVLLLVVVVVFLLFLLCCRRRRRCSGAVVYYVKRMLP